MIDSRGREGKQTALSDPKQNASINRHLYALQFRGEKADECDDDVGKLYFSCFNMSSFKVGGYG